ncbi:unnamed protein product [Auanema sp. JU1783]|nr:unnamed protein product [Auanema sp. JU1783]
MATLIIRKISNILGGNSNHSDMAIDELMKTKDCFSKIHVRTALLHIGLVVTCITYIICGAYVFQVVEKPMAMKIKEKALSQYESLTSRLLHNFTSRNQTNVEKIMEEYIESLFFLFDKPYYAHIFEAHYTNSSVESDLWTFSDAVLFTTTTVIPVGYGFIWPATPTGRILVIIYGMVGIPLALVTMADTGKFLSQLVTNWFEESITIPTVLFLSLLFFYPILGGLVFHYYADLSFLDATYFSLTSIFTIGFGDITPKINIIHLVMFIVFGVILVTITIDFVAAEMIDHVHYMGRHVGKAKELAGKMLQMAQSINMNKGISGLTAGMNQLQALARMGLLGKVDKETLETGQPVSAFAPVLDDVDFVDRASIYASRSDIDASPPNGRNLFF